MKLPPRSQEFLFFSRGKNKGFAVWVLLVVSVLGFFSPFLVLLSIPSHLHSLDLALSLTNSLWDISSIPKTSYRQVWGQARQSYAAQSGQARPTAVDLWVGRRWGH